MRRNHQETREEKLSRQIRNLTAALEHQPNLRSVRKRKAEMEARLRDMPLEEKSALVPWEETARETKECIATCDELIAEIKTRLEEKGQAVEEVKSELAEMRATRAKLLRQAKMIDEHAG